ncbi:hypothetical protein ACOMHN_030483 [Nucella lapillus]
MVAAKGNRTVGFLRRNLKDCTTEVRKATYTTMVRPTLEYASTVWDPHTRQDIDLLEKVKKRAARFACNCYFERAPGTVTDLLRKLQWDSLETRRHHNRLGMLYRIENGLVDIPPSTALLNPGLVAGTVRQFSKNTLSIQLYTTPLSPEQ